MTEAEAEKIILSFPEVERGTSYGYPSFKVAGKFFTRLRAEDASLVISDVNIDEREMLMEADPKTFHLTPHYQNYPTVLARIKSLKPAVLRSMLERTWRKKAPKKLVKAYDAAKKD
jgi:hypothetical protein